MIIKKALFTLTLLLLFISCSDDGALVSESIIGKWYFKGELDDNDQLIVNDSCSLEGYVVYYLDNTYESISYETIDNNCQIVTNTQYNKVFQLKGDILESSYDYLYGPGLGYGRSRSFMSRIRFIDSDTMERIHLSPTTGLPYRKSIWERREE